MGGRERGVVSLGGASPSIATSSRGGGWSEDDHEVRFRAGDARGRGGGGFGLSGPENSRDLQRERQPFVSLGTPTRATEPSSFRDSTTPVPSHEQRLPRATPDGGRPVVSSSAAPPPPHPARKVAVPLRPAGSSLVSSVRSESASHSEVTGDATTDVARSRVRRFGPDASMMSSSSQRLGDAETGHVGFSGSGSVRPPGDARRRETGAPLPALALEGALSRGASRVQAMVKNVFSSLPFRDRDNKTAPKASAAPAASVSASPSAGLGASSPVPRSLRRPRRKEGSGRDAPIVLLGSDDDEESDEEERGDDDRVAVVDSGGASPDHQHLQHAYAASLKPSTTSASAESFNFADSDILHVIGGSAALASASYDFGADGVPVPVWEAYLPGRAQAAFVTRPVPGHEAGAKSCSAVVFKRPIRSLELRLFHPVDKYPAAADSNDTISDISDVFCRKETIVFSFDSIKSIRCGSHIGSSKGNSLGDTRFVAVDARPESVDGSADATLLLAVFDEDSYNKFIREAFSITDLSGKIEFVNNLDDIASLRLARAAAGVPVLLSSPPSMGPSDAALSLSSTAWASSSSVAGRLRSKRRRSGDETLVQDLTKRPEPSASSVAPDTVLFVFPMEKKALDVITIMSCDRDRLMHSDCLNDNLIDLRLRLIVSGTSASDYASAVRKGSCNAKIDVTHPARCSAHAFSCHFYSLLSKRGSHKDQRTITAMCKNVDIFNLDFLFIPIHQAGHWSLVCVVRPGILAKQRNKDLSQSFPDSSENRSCLLHLDSLSLHSTSSVLSNVAAFLSEEFARRASMASAEQLSQPSPSSGERKLTGQRVFNKIECPFVKCKQVCQQENGVDCGVFVIKYVEMILNANPTSTPEDIRTEFHDYFQPLMFSQTDADVERIKFINDIDVLSECWLELCRRREALRRDRAAAGRSAKGAVGGGAACTAPAEAGGAEDTETSDDGSRTEDEGPLEPTLAEIAHEESSAARDRGSSNIKAALAGLIARKVNG